ncbi:MULTISPECIES: ABC transporter substrate-binding protein [unclassified Ornithinimicrobium]|uniref:ABC transporter substrate-binding protein n=1 Tax=unclassified Ornithinimicrobium TaxID=2615080 RepID=UPI0038554439
MSSTSLRSRRSVTTRALAAVAASSLVLAACGNGDDDTAGDDTETDDSTQSQPAAGGAEGDLTLKVGTVLPQTGNLAFLGPPEEAGVSLAAKEINDAGLGITVEVTYGDSGDTDNKAYATTVPQLLSAGVNVIVGAASSGVSKLFIDEVTGAGVLQISPANTSPDFTDWDDDNLYWRTAPSDLLQGDVLGNLVAEDGNQTASILYINDAYGTGLERAFTEVFEAAGGEVVASESYNTGDTTFDAQISTLTAANADTMVLITFDEAVTIVPALSAAGVDTGNLYFVDGNLKNYGDQLDAGILEGSKGTLPGPALEDDFQTRLNENWEAEGNDPLEDYSYAGESYDAVVLNALAALAAGSAEGADIASKMQEVSGGSGGGEKATDVATALQIVVDGGVVDWDGPSGPITFDEKGDPTEATIGIYQYDAENMYARLN